MQFSRQQLRLLGLSNNEYKVLRAIRYGHNTPTQLSQHLGLVRSSIYTALTNLQSRRLVTSYKRNGQKRWQQNPEPAIHQEIINIKKQLFNIPRGSNDPEQLHDSTVIIHRGASAIQKLLPKILKKSVGKRIQNIQGDERNVRWQNVFSPKQTEAINKLVSEQKLVIENIMPTGWFERQVRYWGISWGRNFIKRLSVMREIDPSFFDHGGQLWVHSDAVYLVALREKVVIEIRSGDIQKMVLAMYRFIESKSKTCDIKTAFQRLSKSLGGPTSK